MCIEWNDDWLIKDIYEHQNSNSMNEYRGFKVGDRVEITFSSAHPIKGTITSFGDRKLGGFAEPDTMDVWISETTRYDMIYLVSHDLIKKLPKYAVGDVVRSVVNGSIFTVKEIGENHYHAHEGTCFSENKVEPFDGFRVGDTVFTVKRGKGKIVADRESMPRRFKVVFEADKDHPTIICRHPKLTNLIPTEAEYKAATTGFKVDIAIVTPYNPKSNNLIETRCNALMAEAKKAEKIAKIKAAGEAFYQAAKNMAAAIGRTTDQIKFPSGGVVFDTPICRAEAITPLPLGKLKWYTDNVVCGVEESLYSQLVVTEKGVCKYKSKFGMGELVSYAGCIRAVVDKIHYKDGKFTYDLRTNSCPEGLPEDSLSAVVAPSAKFKTGDAVYFKNIGHSLCATENPNKYIVENPNAAGGFVTLKRWDNKAAATCRESDLRLWVETKFTHKCGFDTIHKTEMKPSDYKVAYLGNNIITGKDTFSGTQHDGKIDIFFGIKGDDIS